MTRCVFHVRTQLSIIKMHRSTFACRPTLAPLVGSDTLRYFYHDEVRNAHQPRIVSLEVAGCVAWRAAALNEHRMPSLHISNRAPIPRSRSEELEMNIGITFNHEHDVDVCSVLLNTNI